MDKLDNIPFLNLTGVGCPMAFVRARLFLDGLSTGKTAYILFEDTPANAPLARSIKALGHDVTFLTPAEFSRKVENDQCIKGIMGMTAETQLTLIQVQVNSN